MRTLDHRRGSASLSLREDLSPFKSWCLPVTRYIGCSLLQLWSITNKVRIGLSDRSLFKALNIEAGSRILRCGSARLLRKAKVQIWLFGHFLVYLCHLLRFLIFNGAVLRAEWRAVPRSCCCRYEAIFQPLLLQLHDVLHIICFRYFIGLLILSDTVPVWVQQQFPYFIASF